METLAVIGKRVGRISGVHVHCESPLFAVADAEGFVGLSLRLRECRQQQPCEDGDDGDDDQQLNQGETDGMPGLVRPRATRQTGSAAFKAHKPSPIQVVTISSITEPCTSVNRRSMPLWRKV